MPRCTRTVTFIVGVALFLAGCASTSGPAAVAPADQAPADQAPTATAAPEPTATSVPITPLAMNHVQLIGSHNSYHLLPPEPIFDALQALSPELAAAREYEHRSLTEQLEMFGVRQLELDVYADPDGGLYSNPAANVLVGLPALDAPQLVEPGFKVLHIQDYDYATTCLTLVLCLEEVATWSSAHPTHLPVVVLVEFKSESVPESAAGVGIELPALAWTTPIGPTEALLMDLDAEIRSVFGPEQLIVPDDVRGGAATLDAAVTTQGWPPLVDGRGKVVFVLIGGSDVRDLYVAESEVLEGRPMFTNSAPGDADAAFVLIDDPTDPTLASVVESGYLVRTRTDVPTGDARNNDQTRLDNATASGAHFLSTDYYSPSELFDSPYVASLPGDQIARCNPLTAPPTCTADQLTE